MEAKGNHQCALRVEEKRIKAESENHGMELPDERRLGMEDLAELYEYKLNWL